MHFYNRHIGDFQLATRGLRLLEKGAYSELLDHYYSTERPLPFDKKELFRICGSSTPAEKESVIAVVTRFFYAADDGYRNKRCDEEIAMYHAKLDRLRTNGKSGGRPKKPNGKPNENQKVFLEKPKANHLEKLSINHEPITNNQEENTNTPLTPLLGECAQSSPESKSASTPSDKSSAQGPAVASVRVPRAKSGSNYSEDFNRWFAAYPRQVAKGAAWKAWPSALAHFRARSKAATEESAVEELINVTVIYGLSPCCAVEPEFVPHPATWLNQRRFEDDPKEWQRVSGGAGSTFSGNPKPVGSPTRYRQTGADSHEQKLRDAGIDID